VATDQPRKRTKVGDANASEDEGGKEARGIQRTMSLVRPISTRETKFVSVKSGSLYRTETGDRGSKLQKSFGIQLRGKLCIEIMKCYCITGLSWGGYSYTPGI
jgi:hypothetical protein